MGLSRASVALNLWHLAANFKVKHYCGVTALCPYSCSGAEHENGIRASTGSLHQAKQDRGTVQLSHWIRVKVYLVQWSEPKGGHQPTDVRQYSHAASFWISNWQINCCRVRKKLLQGKKVLGQFEFAGGCLGCYSSDKGLNK